MAMESSIEAAKLSEPPCYVPLLSSEAREVKYTIVFSIAPFRKEISMPEKTLKRRGKTRKLDARPDRIDFRDREFRPSLVSLPPVYPTPTETTINPHLSPSLPLVVRLKLHSKRQSRP